MLSVLVFEIVLNGTSMFNHSNVRLGKRGWIRVLRRVLVTPDMHRVHHSSERDETDSNYGFNFPVLGPAVRNLCSRSRNAGTTASTSASQPIAATVRFGLLLGSHAAVQKKLTGK